MRPADRVAAEVETRLRLLLLLLLLPMPRMRYLYPTTELIIRALGAISVCTLQRRGSVAHTCEAKHP